MEFNDRSQDRLDQRFFASVNPDSQLNLGAAPPSPMALSKIEPDNITTELVYEREPSLIIGEDRSVAPDDAQISIAWVGAYERRATSEVVCRQARFRRSAATSQFMRDLRQS